MPSRRRPQTFLDSASSETRRSESGDAEIQLDDSAIYRALREKLAIRRKNMEILKELFETQTQKEADMNFRYPWFNMIYNYIVAAVLLALAVSLVVWSVNESTQRKVEEEAAIALAAYQKELQEAEDAKAQELAAQRASEEYVIQQEAEAVAKAFYGIRLFIERYRYDESDLETYARCMFNRSETSKTSLQSVISREDQFTGYSDNNIVLDVYYKPALKFVEAWHSETIKPCDLSNVFAELTDKGIFLVSEYGADGYVRRWHA